MSDVPHEHLANEETWLEVLDEDAEIEGDELPDHEDDEDEEAEDE